jgi:hypothetical protein
MHSSPRQAAGHAAKGFVNEARSLLGERRFTVVFDRGGWSPKLFAKLVAVGFDLLTYRKGAPAACRGLGSASTKA